MDHPPPSRLAPLVESLVDLFLPADCVVCGTPGTRLCAACGHALAAAVGQPRRAEQGARSLPLLGGGEPLPVMAGGAYEPPLSTAVLAFKDHHALHLRPLLGDALTRAVAAARLDPGMPGAATALLVPVPGGAEGFRRRGYDPLTELTRSLPHPVVRHDVVRPAPVALLPRVPGTGLGGPSHAGAGVGERRARARRWRVRPDTLRGGAPVLLVDDVLTTGATLAALDAAVRRAGGRPVGAVVLAAVTPPSVAPPPLAAPPVALAAEAARG